MAGRTKKTPEELAASREKSNANLHPERGKDTQFKAGRQQAEIARKGGLKRQQIYREERTVRQMMEQVMGCNPVLTPNMRANITSMGMNPDEGSYTAAFLSQITLAQKCMKGDIRAYQKYLEIIEQDPRVLLEQERLRLEKESLQQGIGGYSALDDAFAQMAPVADNPQPDSDGDAQ